MSDVSDAYQSPETPGDPEPKKRGRFTLVELLVVLAIICMLVALTLPFGRYAGEASRRMQCSNNLKQIALALHNYQDTYGTLPPAYIAGKDGTPLHSWRVLILPFLEQSALYDQYRFDEPWNGPHNRKLAEHFPEVYRCPSYSPQRTRYGDAAIDDTLLTQYVAVRGGQTVFPGARAMKLEAIGDGTANTLMVVELGSECVPWMAPRDIDLAGLARVRRNEDGNHPGGFLGALADGSVRFISDTIDRESLRGLSTANGGEEPIDF